ncbi:MAG: metallophosphoesterase family protein [Candidatus Ranarchaeia archaeon]|jgi:Icc-related predicted phosphoesterase
MITTETHVSEVKGNPILVCATSDIHVPQYLEIFRRSLMRIQKNPDLFLLAGDVVDLGVIAEYVKVLDIMEEFGIQAAHTFAVFGNTEYDDTHDLLIDLVGKRVTFLNDETKVLNIRGDTIGIVGTRGVLDQPTYWQSQNLHEIEETYNIRLQNIKKQVQELSTKFRIFLTHYAPTYSTLKGENVRAYKFMGTSKLESTLSQLPLDLIIHGHAHQGTPTGFLGLNPVFNVALPLNNRIIQLQLPYGNRNLMNK